MCHSCSDEEKQRRSEAKLEVEQLQRRKISEVWEPRDQPARPIDDYTLMDAVFMLSMVRGGAAEDYSYIKPVNFFEEPLTPNSEFDNDFLNHIVDREIFTPHPGSSISAFEFTQDGPTKFYLHKVHWVMPQWGNIRDNTGAIESMVARIESLLHWKKSIPFVWRDIVLQEGIELLKHYAREHQFDVQVGEKTTDILTTILERYSLGQLQNLLWRATRDAAAYYVRERVPKARAANSIITRLQGSYERALADSWEVKPYNRLFNLPQSLISKVFFNFVMRMPDSYRTSLPPDKLV